MLAFTPTFFVDLMYMKSNTPPSLFELFVGSLMLERSLSVKRGVLRSRMPTFLFNKIWSSLFVLSALQNKSLIIFVTSAGKLFISR